MGGGTYHRWPRPVEYGPQPPEATHWPSRMPKIHCIAPATNFTVLEDTLTGQDTTGVIRGRETDLGRGVFWFWEPIVLATNPVHFCDLKAATPRFGNPPYRYVVTIVVYNIFGLIFATGNFTLETYPNADDGPHPWSKPQEIVADFTFEGPLLRLLMEPVAIKDIAPFGPT